MSFFKNGIVGKFGYLLEDVDLMRSGGNKVSMEGEDADDITNFIYANTNGGTEKFTVWTYRTNDSKTDPTKKAGDVMEINGSLKIPKTAIVGTGSAIGDAEEAYKNYDLLRIYVSNLDGENYIAKYPDPKKRIRSFKVNPIFKLKIGKEIYHIVNGKVQS